MKISFAILFSMMMSGVAQADCAFGQNTWELEEKFEPAGGEREFAAQERISLSRPQRLGGLQEVEIKMIDLMMQEQTGQQGILSEILAEFSQTDGYLAYFAHASMARQFVQVGHYPGDNENGVILEISVRPEGVHILGILARIEDGEFSQCAAL